VTVSYRRLREGAAALAMLLGFAAMPASGKTACPDAPVPRLRVIVLAGEPQYDRSLSAEALEAMGASAAPDWLHGRGRLLGLTQHQIGLDYDGLTAITAPGPDGTCVGFRDGTLALVAAATIHIAAEIPAGSCLDREAIGHELKHHARGLELLEAHARDLERRFADALTDEPFVLAPEDQVAAAAIARLRDLMEPARREFDEAYVSAQLALDTPQEYQRILDACPGEQQRLLRP